MCPASTPGTGDAALSRAGVPSPRGADTVVRIGTRTELRGNMRLVDAMETMKRNNRRRGHMRGFRVDQVVREGRVHQLTFELKQEGGQRAAWPLGGQGVAGRGNCWFQILLCDSSRHISEDPQSLRVSIRECQSRAYFRCCSLFISAIASLVTSPKTRTHGRISLGDHEGPTPDLDPVCCGQCEALGGKEARSQGEVAALLRSVPHPGESSLSQGLTRLKMFIKITAILSSLRGSYSIDSVLNFYGKTTAISAIVNAFWFLLSC